MKNDRSQRAHLLVVDNEPLIRQLIAGSLETEEFYLHFATSGEDALALCPSLKPDLIILDMELPGMDGIETCHVLRHEFGDSLTPILMLTSDSASIIQTLEAGITDYLPKPFQPKLFIHRLRSLLKAGKTANNLHEYERKLLLLREAVESLPIGITLTDGNGKIIYSNPAEALIHGYTVDELKKIEAAALGPLRLKKGISISDLQSYTTWKRETINRHKNGNEFPVQLTSIPVKDSSGNYIGIVTACEDISERKIYEEKIHQLAFIDTLTGLPNRWNLRDRLTQIIAMAARENKELALLYLDLDRFKFINDTMGHDFGDKLLSSAAQRLKECMRKADLVARLGGDEFVVLLTGLDEDEGVAAAAKRIQKAFSHPFELEGRTVFTSPSIGISVYPKDGSTGDLLLKNADAAMYHSKAVGGGNYHFYSEEMNQRFAEKMNLENQMRHALENQEFVLHYQPQIDLNTGRLSGVEALVRWQNPEHGLIMPSLFIGILEETGLILRLGEWVLREACRQAQQWRSCRFPELKTAINISGRQLKQPGFVQMVQDVIHESGVDPSALEFELTESSIISDIDHACLILKQIKSLGIRVSIDDFGTGYSSLCHIKSLPIDCIKIDRSFIVGITRNRDDDAIVKAIIHMAQNLGVTVVAEGVEMPEQVNFLRKCGCDLSQGFFFSKPLSGDLLSEVNSPVSWPKERSAIESNEDELFTFKVRPNQVVPSGST